MKHVQETLVEPTTLHTTETSSSKSTEAKKKTSTYWQ